MGKKGGGGGGEKEGMNGKERAVRQSGHAMKRGVDHVDHAVSK